VGLEPTTGGLREVRPRASYALPARIPRSRAADGANCAICTGGSVHEPVHDYHSERLTSTTERYRAPRDIRRYVRAVLAWWHINGGHEAGNYVREAFAFERMRLNGLGRSAEDSSGPSGAMHLGLYRWLGGCQICGAVQQWLAAQAGRDVAGLRSAEAIAEAVVIRASAVCHPR
jgi:hypothetical protein